MGVARAPLARFRADATLFSSHDARWPSSCTVGSSRSRANSSATARGGSECGSPRHIIDSAHTAQEEKERTGRPVRPQPSSKGGRWDDRGGCVSVWCGQDLVATNCLGRASADESLVSSFRILASHLRGYSGFFFFWFFF
jgi:hypothetical protein